MQSEYYFGDMVQPNSDGVCPRLAVYGVGLQEVVKRVQPLLLEPDFTYAVMRTKSAAAANLCNWVINIINFNQVT